jgi:hypothetical protein
MRFILLYFTYLIQTIMGLYICIEEACGKFKPEMNKENFHSIHFSHYTGNFFIDKK